MCFASIIWGPYIIKTVFFLFSSRELKDSRQLCQFNLSGGRLINWTIRFMIKVYIFNDSCWPNRQFSSSVWLSSFFNVFIMLLTGSRIDAKHFACSCHSICACFHFLRWVKQTEKPFRVLTTRILWFISNIYCQSVIWANLMQRWFSNH